MTAAKVAIMRPEPLDYADTLQETFLNASSRPSKANGSRENGDLKRAALENLHRLAQLRKVVEDEIARNVAIARTNTSDSEWYSDAATWVDLGQALGVSKQAVQGRYGK